MILVSRVDWGVQTQQLLDDLLVTSTGSFVQRNSSCFSVSRLNIGITDLYQKPYSTRIVILASILKIESR